MIAPKLVVIVFIFVSAYEVGNAVRNCCSIEDCVDSRVCVRKGVAPSEEMNFIEKLQIIRA